MYKITVQRCGLYEPTKTKEIQLAEAEEAFEALKELIDDRFSLMVRIRESDKDPHILICEVNLSFNAVIQVLVSHDEGRALNRLGKRLFKECNAYSYRYKSNRRSYRD